MYVRGCFDKYISAATWPPQIKIPDSTPDHWHAQMRTGKNLPT